MKPFKIIKSLLIKFKVVSTFASVLTITLTLPSTLKAQEGPTLVFNYDEAGNLTERKVQVFPMGRFSLPKAPEKDSIPLQQHFQIFPNPTYNTLNVEGVLPKEYTQANMQLFSLNGQLVKSETYVSGDKKSIDVSQLKNGLYLLVISYSEKDRETYKIIVNN